MGETWNLLFKDYGEHLGHLIELLSADGLPFFDPYPALKTLLLKPCKKRERRKYLIDLLAHLRDNLTKAQPERDTRTGRIFAYSITVSMGYISAVVWKISKTYGQGDYQISKTAQSLSLLFAETMLLNRQTALPDQTQGLSDPDAKQRNRQIYRFWVDGWTPAQMAVKEAKAQAWLDAGAPPKLDKSRAIEIFGQHAADAATQNGRKKTKLYRQHERFCEQAYTAIVNRTGRAVVSKAEMLDELRKHVPRKRKNWLPQAQETEKRWQAYLETEDLREATFRTYDGHELTKDHFREKVRREYAEDYQTRCRTSPERYWQDGKTALLSNYALECRQLTREEKIYYNVKARQGAGFLVPRRES